MLNNVLPKIAAFMK